MTSRIILGRVAARAAALSIVLAAGCDDGDAVTDPSDTTAAVTVEGSETTAAEPAVETAEVDMVDISFDPTDIAVPVGATVAWTNRDAVDHTSTSEGGTWDSGVLAPGESFEFTFDEAGIYPYLCEIHPTVMRGTITVE